MRGGLDAPVADDRLAGKHIRGELECVVELPIVEDANRGFRAQGPYDDRKPPGPMFPIGGFVAGHEEAGGFAGGALYFDMAFGPSLREDEIEPTVFPGNVEAGETLCLIMPLDGLLRCFLDLLSMFRGTESAERLGRIGTRVGHGVVCRILDRDRFELFQAAPQVSADFFLVGGFFNVKAGKE